MPLLPQPATSICTWALILHPQLPIPCFCALWMCRRRAAEHGHSTEGEVHHILRQVVEPTTPKKSHSTLRGIGLTHSQPLRPAQKRRVGVVIQERHPFSS